MPSSCSICSIRSNGFRELLDGASYEFDMEKVQSGRLSPVFFGSALTNCSICSIRSNGLRDSRSILLMKVKIGIFRMTQTLKSLRVCGSTPFAASITITAESAANYQKEIERRRTFAIISHPDAGKTTLTEKFLLYGGAIQLAGSVKGKKTARHAVSDWMEIEKQRGISVTSSVMQFNYNGFCINILDTPGHQDFSEDTYRTLMAAPHPDAR